MTCDTGHYASLPPSPHLAELLDPVRPKGDESGAPGAGLHSRHCIVGGGIRPQQVHQHRPPVLHGHRSRDGGDLLNLVDAAADASMHAKDLALDRGRQWEVVEQVVDAPPNPYALHTP